MIEILNIEMFGDYLKIGGFGFVFGVLIPFGFRLIGYVVDSVKVVTLKEG